VCPKENNLSDTADNIDVEKSPGYLKERILRISKRVANAQMDLIRTIDELKEHLEEQDLKAFLTIECGLSKNDLPAIFSFADTLGVHETLLRKKAVPLSVVKTLIRTNSETRDNAMLRLYAGQKLDSPDIARIERNRVRLKLGPEAYADRTRHRSLISMASKNSRLQVPDLGTRVDELIWRIDEFVWRQIGFPPEPGETEPFWRNSGAAFDAAHAELKSFSERILTDFEFLYGSSHYKSGDPLPDRNNEIARAHLALRRLANGQFGYEDGFDFEPGNPWSREIQNALTYLLPKYPDDEPKKANSITLGSEYSTTQYTSLKAIELCAGAGGQAIGLLGAGFNVVAAYDSDADAVATLRKNWLWSVRHTRLQDITEEELRAFGEIDLLSGGIECTEFSRAGKQRGPSGPKNLFEEAVRILKIVKPKTFFFENVEGFNDNKFIKYRTSILRRLGECGYSVDAIKLNAFDFGVPQSRKRVIIVGVRNDIEGVFEKPTPVPSLRRNLDSLRATMFPHFGQGHVVYDRHVQEWLDRYGKRPSSTVLASLPSAKPKFRAEWAKKGLMASKDVIMQPALSTSEMSSGSTLQPLTFDLARRLQGFPDAWRIEARSSEKMFELVGNALPSPLSMAVGLALRKTIDGKSYDLAERLSRPVISDEIIQRKHLIHPGGILSRIRRRYQQTEPDAGETTFLYD
jgi:site-specific DNA-cytosine methylase